MIAISLRQAAGRNYVIVFMRVTSTCWLTMILGGRAYKVAPATCCNVTHSLALVIVISLFTSTFVTIKSSTSELGQN